MRTQLITNADAKEFLESVARAEQDGFILEHFSTAAQSGFGTRVTYTAFMRNSSPHRLPSDDVGQRPR